jgi:hypothetical protein
MTHISLALTGGLGNQLFQIAAGMSMSRERIILCPEYGYPRMTNSAPDCYLFHLPKEIGIRRCREESCPISKKVVGFLLRKGIEPGNSFGMRLFQAVLRLLAQAFFAFWQKERYRIFVANDVGYAGEIPIQSNLLIGYFQSYEYLNKNQTLSTLMSLSPANTNLSYRKLLQRARKIKPIIVHARLGDYFQHPHFGIPSEEYYLRGLQTLRRQDAPIWVITNDCKFIESNFNRLMNLNVEVIDDTQLDPAQVMHIMRFGSGYILANSSFSWWAAQLRFDRSTPVVTPLPWFKDIPEPRNLVPKDWVRIKTTWI